MTHQPRAAIRIEIDLHLGQKPKLGGGTPMIRSSTHHILSDLCIFMFRFLYCPRSCFHFFQNTKRPKIFPLFLSIWFFSFLPLVCFICYFQFATWKIQKYFALFAISFWFCFKNRKPQKYLLFFFGFVKFVAEIQSLMTPLELGIHFILFKPHKWKAIMTTYDNPRCGKRLVWTLFVFIFVHILVYVDMLSRFM